MSIANFDILDQLGEGSFSTVFKVLRKSDKQTYALKTVKLDKLSEFEITSTLTEIRVLASIDHPNILGYKEAFVDSGSLNIVTDFCELGDLKNMIDLRKNNGTKFEEQEIWSILLDITKGLKALHDLNIVHRDIKSANIFLCNSGVTKIGDMNVSTVAKHGIVHSKAGTPYFASPEIWKNEPYDFKSDIWSLGVVLYQLVTLCLPFRALSMESLRKRVVRGIYHPIPQNYSAELREMVYMLLQVEPSLRPSCDEILNHPSMCGRSQNFHSTENILLKTILITSELEQLKLPSPKYALNTLRTKKRLKTNCLSRQLFKKGKTERISRKSTINLQQLVDMNADQPLRKYRSKETLAMNIEKLRCMFMEENNPRKRNDN